MFQKRYSAGVVEQEVFEHRRRKGEVRHVRGKTGDERDGGTGVGQDGRHGNQRETSPENDFSSVAERRNNRLGYVREGLVHRTWLT